MITAGIDVGSRTTKAVILEDREWLAGRLIPTGADSTHRAKKVLKKALAATKLRIDDLDNIIATGYGRINVSFAREKVTEITCHGLGAYYQFPGTRTIIDIGGQDSKVIRLDGEGRVEDFVMNDKCAAGTGRFLEVMAENLEVPLEDIGEVSLRAREEAEISSTCTVFAESEVISLVAKGVQKPKILRGLHAAIVRRITGMVHRVGLQPDITMTGGVCLNEGVYNLLSQSLNQDINRPQKPQFTGAYGAALLAEMKCKDN